jgi:hypothetical protein
MAPPGAPGHPDVPGLRALHRELNRTATGGVDDPRGAREVLPPLVGPDVPGIPVPETALPGADLGEVLAARRSSYRYGATPVPLGDLAALLRAALGVQRTVRLPDGRSRALPVAPSAGGLPSLALALVLLACFHLASTTLIVNGIVVRQVVTPDALQGRVNTTARMIAWGGSPLGAAAAGAVAGTAGVEWALRLAAGALLVSLVGALVWGVVRYPRLSALEVVPDPEVVRGG